MKFEDLQITTEYPTREIEFNFSKITLKTYIPIEEKLDLISDVLNKSLDDNDFYNPCRIDIFFTLAVVAHYTDIELDEEKIYETYDALKSSGLADQIFSAMDENELEDLRIFVYQTVESVYKYKNSVMGIMDNITADYKNLELDAEEIASKIKDPESLKLLKEILGKLG